MDDETNHPLEPDAVDAVDVAIVGAGGAGLSLVLALERAAGRAGRSSPSVVVIDPVHRREPDRTWCWWTPTRPEPWFEPLLTAQWPALTVVDRAGTARRLDLGSYRYVMLRSGDLYAAADAALSRLAGTRKAAAVDTVTDDGDRAVVGLDDGRRIRARWVFDSRPAAPRRPGSVLLLQHFRGWTVRFDDPVLDPATATLMDFDIAQPARGVAFAYCLPIDRRRALVEYTEFSRERLPPDAYDLALRAYLRRRWDVAPGAGARIEAVEDGVIPMTDAPFARRVGRRIFRIGTAGGATRPSTGYTFAAIQRQAESVAADLIDGRVPLPPRAYPRRHLWLDAVLLRALDRGYLSGPDMFGGLFAANPPEPVVRFLDGESSLFEELALMRSSPTGPMLRATVADAVARVGRRCPRPPASLRSVVAHHWRLDRPS
jgi:lycopene beta-cyclase